MPEGPVHLLVLRAGTEITARCGARGKAIPQQPPNFTVWQKDVTCERCLGYSDDVGNIEDVHVQEGLL